MFPSLPNETYGFRFTSPGTLHLPLCQLFAVGHDVVTGSQYRWHGLERNDGPLLLFQYTISGQGKLQLNGEHISLTPTMAFLVEIPGDHCYYMPENTPPQEGWQFIFLLIRPHSIMPLWNDIIEQLGRLPNLPLNSAPIEALIELFSAARRGDIVDPYTASSYVYSFFMEFKRFADGNPVQSTIPVAIAQAVKWIDQHYANMISLEQLAEQVGLSKYYFLRSFTKYIGMTPNDYVNRKRIESSLQLLLSTDYPLEQIAQQVGYSNASYYIRVFRKIIGQTPATFRSNKHQLTYKRLFFN